LLRDPAAEPASVEKTRNLFVEEVELTEAQGVPMLGLRHRRQRDAAGSGVGRAVKGGTPTEIAHCAGWSRTTAPPISSRPTNGLDRCRWRRERGLISARFRPI